MQLTEFRTVLRARGYEGEPGHVIGKPLLEYRMVFQELAQAALIAKRKRGNESVSTNWIAPTLRLCARMLRRHGTA